MWSCGVIVYILLGGYPPFHDDNHAILYRKIKAADYAFDPQYWDQVSDDAKDLIKKMLVVDPDKRSISASRTVPSFDATRVHRTMPWVVSFSMLRPFRAGLRGAL